MTVLVYLAGALFVVQAFASHKFVPDPANKLTAKNVMTMTVPWIKDKGKKYDLNLTVHAESGDKGMIIFLGDLGCQRGEAVGKLKHTFFNTGERTIDFRPNQTKDFNLVCTIGSETRGDFKITIAKIYDNPSLDGKTIGKVIAKDLSWSQSDRSE